MKISRILFILILFKGIRAKSNLQCGQTSRHKRTVLRSPNQPLSVANCQYTIRRYSANVCQLLIQFQRFELQQPTTDSVMNTLTCKDAFTAGRFKICGDNNGQHIYLPFTADETVLTFNVASSFPQTNWHLFVEQLECPPAHSNLGNGLPPLISGMVNNLLDMRNLFSRFINDLELLAPAGCDQYFTQPSGVLQSFNYRDGISTHYMSDLKYTICFKVVAAADSIEYTIKRFSLSSELPNEYYNDACHPAISTEGRQSDYLMIPNTYFADNRARQPTYFCGQGLTAGQVLLGSAPFVMYFSSDEQWNPIETGFSIEYRIKT